MDVATGAMSTPHPPGVQHLAATTGRPPVEIHRSTRRRRSGQAGLRDGRIVVRIPAGLPPEEDQALVDTLLGKVLRTRSADDRGGDAWLQRRADLLADRYLDGVRARTVRWSSRMQRRWGSCTPSTGEIRISDRLASAPTFVLDHVLVHELAHLHVPGHDQRFQALLARYPHAERARGYLDGFEAGLAAAARGGRGTDPQPRGSAPSSGPPGSSSSD
ncbi:MAG: M48 family metallopeptidase [Nitriliruptoraceae bacterium]